LSIADNDVRFLEMRTFLEIATNVAIRSLQKMEEVGFNKITERIYVARNKGRTDDEIDILTAMRNMLGEGVAIPEIIVRLKLYDLDTLARRLLDNIDENPSANPDKDAKTMEKVAKEFSFPLEEVIFFFSAITGEALRIKIREDQKGSD
jgi:hypothetical protein